MGVRQWHLKEGYLEPNDDGIIILRSTGNIKDKINNLQITIDHLNNCTIVYNNLYWRESKNSNSHLQLDHRIDAVPLKSTVKLDEVDTSFIEEREYTYSTGWWLWKKNITQKYCIVKEGIVRLNKTPTQHTIHSNRWLIEMVDGSINKNF